MAKKIKLTVELIPKTCHYSNVRTTIKPKEWDRVRFLSYASAGNKCEICKDTGKNQGYPHDLECHEIWEYDDETHTQKLLGLISLCPICHFTKHIGRAIAMGRELICYNQLAQVNAWTQEEIDLHVAESFETYKERSKFEWKLDISMLTKEPYNLVIASTKKRIFEVKKYKKKRRKKKPLKAVLKKRTNKRPKKR
jgi:hypothetical protein